jgi:hypothetical protein
MKSFSAQVLSRGLRGVLASGIVTAALVIGSATTASAQVNFAGSTSFRFNGAGSFNSSATLGGLTVANTGFNFSTDVNGFSGFGGGGNGFGTVSLTGLAFNYSGKSLDMLVNFTNPTTPNQAFSALLHGTIGTSNSGISIVWSSPFISGIPFTNGPGAGTYDLQVNNVSVLKNQTVEISGDVNATVTTPEPASMTLVATGLVGLFGIARRRRNAKV